MRKLPLVVCSLLTWSLSAQEPTPPAPAEPAAPEVPAAAPAQLGSGQYQYTWVSNWGRLGEGKELGNTHGCLVVTKAGTILANTDTEHAIVEYAADGRILRTWGKEFQGGLHGMCLVEEPVEAAGKTTTQEVLYLAHTRRHEIVKTTLDGKVLWTIGWPEQAGIYENENQYNPTAVAVAPDGRIFAADGYGKSWVHVYDRDRKYVTSFGGPGKTPGKMQTPHGLWLDARGKEPQLLVCDRENSRLQWFTLDGEHVRTLDRDLRRPCNVAPLPHGGLVIADLAGRITLFDAKDALVCHVGDNPEPKLRAQNGVPRAQWKDGEFLSPHGIAVDATGSIYVLDWNFLGRVSKLQALPSAPAKGLDSLLPSGK
jgi:DNA-binding beta-propeller fold protein YncE